MTRWVKVLCAAVCSFAVLFSCVGYAAVSGNLSISGKAEYSYPLPDIYISKVTCEKEGSVVSPTVGSDGTILAPTGTTLGFTTTLSTSDNEVVYTITVKNNTDEAVYGYLMTKAMSDEDNASLGLNNGDITYSLWLDPSCSGDDNVMYRKETTVAPKGNLTFYMKVSAKTPNATATTYNALLNFMFVTPVDDIPDLNEDDSSLAANNTMQKFSEILNNPTLYQSMDTQIREEYQENGRYVEGGWFWDEWIGDDFIAYVPGTINQATYTDDDKCLALFGGETLKLVIDGTEREVFFMIKRQNVDGNTSTGVSDLGEEYTLYMTTNNLQTRDEIAIVYAGTFTSDDGGATWYQLGDMLTGEAKVLAYNGQRGTGSFDTDSWRSGDTNTGTNQSLVYYDVNENSTLTAVMSSKMTANGESAQAILASLQEQIAKANNKLANNEQMKEISGENLYSADTLAALEAALTKANNVNSNYTQAMVVSITRELMIAISNLKEV